MNITVNGIDLYYEKTGQGPPIILLHGNGEDHTIFDVLTGQLAPDYTVYSIDSRDHGKSGKVKHLDYRDMMEDVAAFIRELNIQNPILYGFSDGGIIGLLLAIHYPAMLSKLIISGANTHPDGTKKWFLAFLRIMFFFTRSQKVRMLLTQPNITDAELNTIVTPTLVLAGSKDVVKDEHTRNIAENIPGSILKILEGERHESYVIHSEKLYGIMKPYLLPIKRADRNDILNIAVFLDACWREEYRHIVSNDYLDSMSVEERHRGLIKRYDEGLSDFLMMLDNDRLIGAAVYGKSFTEGYEDDGEISAIYLHKDYIGKGYGHCLFAKIEQLLRDKGYSHFVLDLLAGNTRAFEFYLKHGYKRVADRTIKLGENEYPLAVLRKEIV